MSEKRIVTKILKVLREDGFWIKTHGGLFQRGGLPDVLGCFKGRFIGIEVKKPGEEASEIQKYTLKEIIKAGGIAGVATSVEEALEILNDII